VRTWWLVATLALGGCAGRMAAPATAAALAHGIDRVTPAGLAPSSDADLARAIAGARAIYVGESHDDPHHHAMERELYARVLAVDGKTALGLEMLPGSAQPALDDWVAGRIDEDTLLDRVAWEKSWGYPFRWYRPLFLLARAHHQRVFALNAPRGLAKALAHKGLDGLSPEERRDLPEMVPGPAEHRAQLAGAFSGHGAGEGAHAETSDPKALERFYLAQLLWDETMAAAVARALAGPAAPKKILVVTGEGHAKRWAVPLRAERRGVAPSLIVLPGYQKERDAKDKPPADFIWQLAGSAPDDEK
jgi:uncharacterized iron-regulated protein